MTMSNVVCKAVCFTSLSKLARLRKDVEKLEHSLQTTVMKSCSCDASRYTHSIISFVVTVYFVDGH